MGTVEGEGETETEVVGVRDKEGTEEPKTLRRRRTCVKGSQVGGEPGFHPPKPESREKGVRRLGRQEG